MDTQSGAAMQHGERLELATHDDPAGIGNELVRTVNARDLHRSLGVGKDFSNWIKDRIAAYGFNENSDFVVFAHFGENPSGGRPAKEYHLTLDMAKELAMVELNDVGRSIRPEDQSIMRACRSRVRATALPSTSLRLLLTLDVGYLPTLAISERHVRFVVETASSVAEPVNAP